MDEDVKVPDSGEQETQDDAQATKDDNREIDYNKFREYQRKAEKAEKTKAENAELREELARLRGQAEVMSGARKQATSIEQELEELDAILDDPSVFDRPFVEYNKLQNDRAKLLRKIAGKTAGEATDNKLKEFKAEQDLLFKYGRIMEADKEASERYKKIIGYIKDPTPEQRLEIADDIFGSAIKDNKKKYNDMTSFSMRGYSSDETGGKYSRLAADPANRELARQSVKNGFSESEEKYYEKLHKYKLAHDNTYKE